jgi:hypothetical protein
LKDHDHGCKAVRDRHARRRAGVALPDFLPDFMGAGTAMAVERQPLLIWLSPWPW